MFTKNKNIRLISALVFSLFAMACTKEAAQNSNTVAPETTTASSANSPSPVGAGCVGFEQSPSFRRAWIPTKGYDLATRWNLGKDSATKTITIPDTSDVLELDIKAGKISVRRSANSEVLVDYSKAVQEIAPQTENGVISKGLELEGSNKNYNLKIYLEAASIQCPDFKLEGMVLLKKR